MQSVEFELEHNAETRREHLENIHKLIDEREDAKKPRARAIDKELAELEKCVHGIDDYASSHMRDIQDYVEGNGGELPEIPEPIKAVSRKAGTKQETVVSPA